MLYKKVVRPILFRFDPESVHHFVMKWLRVALGLSFVRAIVKRWCCVHTSSLEQTMWGLEFDNPVGLAAGFDKNAEHFNELASLGFGYVEIGTVTGEGQVGNERPRMFRLPEDRGLLNRMGFNNHGSSVVAARLAKKRIEPLLGVNIGKTKVVPLDEAPADYEKSFRRLFDFARYFVVNVSSPNTPGLRELQNKEPLTELLAHLQRINAEMAAQKSVARRPILLKIAPDITDGQLDDILEVIDACDIDGIIATNTTIERDDLHTPGQDELGPGGVSGRPVRQRSVELIRRIYTLTEGRLPIIGVGGIFTAEDALETIRAGASLVQVWTGFIYEGPSAIRRINRGLERACKENGWANIREAVGVDAHPKAIPEVAQ
ncbi:quinone-dependent dihydroorotate dehydrogenase [Persicimonas caeni]|uniref:Dihydroorotate dehydrogenase (quinone) n=1 Tax=Persicimonas caeni TaxID=2292766 RepID=A0A4Y6PNX4_PERCE|nr:quinone-dependent dihydroorotate dehydrogenase [Persicimonas caeni]QDG49903.1 quinone-dependent dihydroorotate dehydrogenase [Persicimonas caeni]QED31124.1 quinone-dependent dihydroorotate dehydrogenase [Persicimonas caeni]